MYQEQELGRAPIRTAEHKIAHGQEWKIASLNVNSIMKPALHKQIEDYMKQHDVAIMCLQETKVAKTTQYVVGDLLYVMHGHGKPEVEYAGVGFVFRKDVRKYITGYRLGPNGRLLAVGIDTAPRRLTLMTIYAPHAKRPEQERVNFYDTLGKWIQETHSKGALIAMGDYNARLHARLAGEDPAIGPHIYGAGRSHIWEPRNQERTNRDLLIEMCMAHGLKVMNTWFQKPHSQKVTYRAPEVKRLPEGEGEPDPPGAPGEEGAPSPGPNAAERNWNPSKFAELDLCVVQERWKGMIHNVRSRTSASVNSDHFPLEVTVALKLASIKPSKQQPKAPKYDFRALNDESKWNYQQEVLAQEGAILGAATIQESWDKFAETIKEALKNNVPEAAKKAKRAWLTANTMELVEHRKALAEAGLIEDARNLDKMVKASAREDKKEWVEQGLKDKFWEPIKAITRKSSPQVVTLKDPTGPEQGATGRGKPAEMYAKHLEKVQWGKGEAEEEADPGEWAGPPIGGGQSRVNTEEITMEELDRAFRSVKNGKAPGIDGLPAEAWLALGEAKGILLEFYNRCWRQETFPKDWKEALVVGIFKKGEAEDPANYRPISLLSTAYKIFGVIMTNRLEAGLADRLRSTQYGFRKGRSTAEPIFILRRIQDLVQAKKNKALHLIFLDWSKAFDKVDTKCLPDVLRRFGVDEKMIRVIATLVKDPEFRVSMQGETSEAREQATGIRQGCTLSPFLFTLILSAIMQDVESKVKQEHPLATTPTMAVMDLEYADDTALIAQTAEIATKLLRYTEAEAARYGLKLNRSKTARLAYNTVEPVMFADGTGVPQSHTIAYLGTLMSDTGHTDEEVRSRMRKALVATKALKPIWGAKCISREMAIRVLRSCVFSALVYSMHTLALPTGTEDRLNALQARCLRRVLRIRPTYGSKLIGEPAITNREVAKRAGAVPLSAELEKKRYQLLGHVLRRDGTDPARAATYDRLAQPKTLGGTNRHGGMRKCWAPAVIESAANEAQAQGLLGPPRPGGGPSGHPYAKLAALAQTREQWSAWINVWYKKQDWQQF